jgi:hypothetical protein
MENMDSLPRDAQSILELAARSMFDLFANASEGMMLVDRAARVVWINDQYKAFSCLHWGLSEKRTLWAIRSHRLCKTPRCTRCWRPASLS